MLSFIPALGGTLHVVGACVNRIGTGGWRNAKHAGTDWSGEYGEPIIAAADGFLYDTFWNEGGCGIGLSISHRSTYSTDVFTVYCHMSGIANLSGKIRRGDVIGWVGTSGNAWGIPHVHLEVSTDGDSHRDGDLGNTKDPEDYVLACFIPDRVYDPTTFELSRPLRCVPD